MNFKRAILTGISLTGLALAGCSDDSDDDDLYLLLASQQQEPAETGVLLDSPVANVDYVTATQEGVTNSAGEFDYLPGETVTFSIGDLDFPAVSVSSTISDGIVTPLDLAGSEDLSDSTVVNIIRLLQSLDEDGNPDNGITISDTAKAAATQVDFSLSVSDFAASSAVVNLVSNSGSVNTTLVSTEDALAHFEDSLASNDVEFGSIVGTWLVADPLNENELLMLVFLDDATYVHAEVDFEQAGEEPSGMEWGTYSIDSSGIATVTQDFDNNSTTGLTDFVGTSDLKISVSGDILTLDIVGGVDAGDSISFDRQESSGVLGAWLVADASNENELLMLVFLDDGTYVHAEVDFEQAGDEPSGMEWGTYSIDSSGIATVTQDFDNNSTTGLTDFVGTSDLKISASGDTLTLDIVGGVDAGDSISFDRQ